MNRILMAAAFGLAAASAQAQTAPADPARPDAAVPPTRYTSPLAPFRASTDPAQPPSATWPASNAAVADADGHAMRGMHHEGHQMAPAKPMQHDSHKGHEGMHGKPEGKQQQSPAHQEHHQ